MKTRTGRKPKHYRAADGREIHGLTRNPDGRWRIVGTQTRWSEPDEQAAIERFERLTNKGTPKQQLARAGIRVFDPDSPLERILNSTDPEKNLWRVVGDEIRTSPKLIAELTGVEEIGYFRKLKPPAPLPTLALLEATWMQYARCTQLQAKKVKRAWDDFLNSTKINALDEIVPEVVVAYQDDVHARGLSSKQQHHLFSGIKRLLRFCKRRALAIDEITRVLSYLEILQSSETGTTLDPKPVEVEDWRKLLAVADGDDKALLLLMLNGCFYIQEVINLEWQDIKSGCIVTNRRKTGKCIRVCTLWPETLAALEKVKRRNAYIFNTYAGLPIKVSGAQRRWQRLALKAGLATERDGACNKKVIKCGVTASQLRDGAYTAAASANVNSEICRLLGGHRCGIQDHYVRRNPKMVAPACEAVRRVYFS